MPEGLLSLHLFFINCHVLMLWEKAKHKVYMNFWNFSENNNEAQISVRVTVNGLGHNRR